MLAGYMLKVLAFICQALCDWVDTLPFALEIGRGRVDCEPVNGEIRLEFAQFAGNSEIALDVPQANGAREKECPPRAAHGSRPGSLSWRSANKVPDGTVEQRGIAQVSRPVCVVSCEPDERCRLR